MAVCRAQVTIPATNGAPEDVVVNTWGFKLNTASGSDAGSAASALLTFYTAVVPRMSNLQNWAASNIKFYDLSDPKPRAPFYDANFTIGGTPQSSHLPRELAICLSFQGARVSGSAQARRRGRVYLGPLGLTSNDSTTGRPLAAAISSIQGAAGTLRSASGSGVWTWIVVSEVAGLNDVIVTNGWVDNAFDIQRRRGVTPTSRSTF